MSGLMAATTLSADRQITILDKGRSVGGRLATRRLENGRADHGAQFFTVRDEAFALHVDRWLSDGLVFRWSTGWGDGSADATPSDGHPRYAVRGGMNALAKHLAAQLTERRSVEIQTGVTVSSIAQADEGWKVVDRDGQAYQTAQLVLTAPVPQALALLDAGNTQLSTADRASLERIAYASCLCAIAVIDGESTLPEPGAKQRPEAPISWIADNRRKGISPDLTVLTAHADPAFSQRLYDEPDDAIMPTFEEALHANITPGSRIKAIQIKRWRYALPLVLHPNRRLQATGLPPLFFGGDAFGGPRIEGAALSGMAIGEVISTL